MNKFSILFISSLLLLACDKAEKEDHFEIGNLTLSKSQPQPGDQIDINYKVDNTSSENTPEAFLYYITDDKNHIEDLSLTENNGTFKAQVKIPDSATAIAFNFKTGETYDTNEKNGYVIPLYSDQSIIEGTASSVAWFKLTNGSQYGFDIPVDSAFTVINEEYKNNTEQMDAWSMPLINIANQSDKKRAEVLMQNYLDNLRAKNNLTEQEYNNINRIYDLQKNKIAQDSITKIALEKYPKGALARREYIDQMRNTKGLEAEKAILDAYEKNIGSTGFERDYILSIVASSYMENSDFKNFEKYAEMQDSETSVASLYNNQAWDMAQNDKNLDEAEKFSKRSLEFVDKAKTDLGSKPDYYSINQYKSQLEGSTAMYSDTYAYILFKEGKIKDALKYQEMALDGKKSPEVNERYIQYLIANENFEKAKTESEGFIENNTSTAKIKEYLATAYEKTESENTDFDSYLVELEKVGKEKAMAHLKETMIDEEAPQFNLTNLDGEQVALADLKGKTVVLDFWATWCGPCKVSFPGMQMAVDNYKDDPDVEFLFVDTWESTSGDDRKNSVSDFIKENKYSFNVLMDTPVEEGSNQYTVVSDYKVDGIPTKFVLGPDGRIKFKAVGFDGNTEGLAKEIEMMINLAKS